MTWLLSPLTWLLLAVALAPLAKRLRARGPWLLAGCGVLAALSLAGMTPLGANALVVPLERAAQAPRACHGAPPSTAVVLGGGADGRPASRGDYSVLNLASRRRMDRAVAWWREREGRVLVLASGPRRSGMAAGAELMAAYAAAQGVPATGLRLEADSRDTWGNARNSARLQPRLPRRIALITSLTHMPRAQAAFASAGFDTCPLGTDARRLPSRLPWALVPRTSALVNTEVAVHEWVGMAYYRWRARQAQPGTH